MSRNKERRLQTDSALMNIFLESSDSTQSVPRILQVICEYMDWESGIFWRIEKESNQLRYIGMWTSSLIDETEILKANKLKSFSFGVGIPGGVWKKGRAEWFSDISGNIDLEPVSLATSSNVHSACALPILWKGEPIGVMEFFSQEVQCPDEKLLPMMDEMGKQIGFLLGCQERLMEQEALIQELKHTLANTKILRGMFGMCATCRKIRDANGQWNDVEDFISANTHATISHGICTDCARKLHPDWDDN